MLYIVIQVVFYIGIGYHKYAKNRRSCNDTYCILEIVQNWMGPFGCSRYFNGIGTYFSETKFMLGGLIVGIVASIIYHKYFWKRASSNKKDL